MYEQNWTFIRKTGWGGNGQILIKLSGSSCTVVQVGNYIRDVWLAGWKQTRAEIQG